MMLCSPAIEVHNNGDVLWTCWRSAIALSKCPAIIDFDYASRAVHPTDGVLSQNIPMVVCCSDLGATFSSVNHTSKTPAISKSEFVSFPVGFD